MVAIAVTLQNITPDNWEQCIQLQVHEAQRGFVADNVYSLAQTKVFPELIPQAICADGTVVGFALYGTDRDTGRYWLTRLMIDKAHQGKGYGRAATQAVLRILELISDCHEVFLCVEPENAVAMKLYTSLGFTRTGDCLGNEFVMRKQLK